MSEPVTHATAQAEQLVPEMTDENLYALARAVLAVAHELAAIRQQQ